MTPPRHRRDQDLEPAHTDGGNTMTATVAPHHPAKHPTPDYKRCYRGHVNDHTTTRCRLCAWAFDPPSVPDTPTNPPHPRRRVPVAALLTIIAVIIAVAIAVVIAVIIAMNDGPRAAITATTSTTSTATVSALTVTTSSVPSVASVASPITPARAFAPLNVDDQGVQVATLQELLRGLGYTIIGPDIFGPQTERAVIAFKEKHGLPATPLVDATTWALLTATATAPTTTPSDSYPT